MLLKFSAAAWRRLLKPQTMYLVACGYIALALGGSLLLTACGHTEAGIQRETALYQGTSNTVENVRQALPYVPPPANGILEGVVAVGGALLALWATHLQRSLNDVRNGKSKGPAAPGAPTAGAG